MIEIDRGGSSLRRMLTPEQHEKNEKILAVVEALGGGYVWDHVVFAVIIDAIPVTDADVEPLSGLAGVEQIALNAALLSANALERVARIVDLTSLVLIAPRLSNEEISRLRAIGPEITVVDD